MTISVNILSRLAKAALAAGLMTISLVAAGPASAELIYRGLLTDNQGALDMRTNRFAFNLTLSFNKTLNSIFNAPQNFQCALQMDTVNALPNIGSTSPIRNFSSFEAQFDQAPPNPPAGHVSVTVAAPFIFGNPAETFANELKSEAMNTPETFAETYIVGVPNRESDEDCRLRAKHFN
ncbi:hypothetical protein [Rhizobium sp. SAFR-030]|uniref:hypothetical protein n=1 Tax=Rhizobium sp. SAFR-030 TaxID=3387277 RepID=UPI003F7DD77A